MCICARSLLIQQCLNFGAEFVCCGEVAGARSGRPPLLAVYKSENMSSGDQSLASRKAHA